MPLDFVFPNFADIVLLDIIVLGVTLVTNFLLILSSYDLKKNESTIRYSNYMLIIAIFIFIYGILDILLPDIVYSPLADGTHVWQDLKYGFAYDFTRFQSIELALIVILGMSFLLLALENDFPHDRPILIGGALLALGAIMTLTNFLVYYFNAWLYGDLLSLYEDVFILWQMINYPLMIVGLLFLLWSGVKGKQSFLIGYTFLQALVLLYTFWNFVF